MHVTFGMHIELKITYKFYIEHSYVIRITNVVTVQNFEVITNKFKTELAQV